MHALLTRSTPFVELAGAPEREVIPPTDSRQHLPNTLAVPHRWICSLDVVRVKDGKGVLHRGTGVLVGPRMVLTAAHNIWGHEGRSSPRSVHVAVARNGREDPLGLVRAVAYRRLYRRRDLALVLLENSFATRRHKALGNQPLGYWGSPTLGQGTELGSGPRPGGGRVPIVVCGYPGDRCGTRPFDPERGTCATGLQASTQWQSRGASWSHTGTRFLHDADTHEGQSGSPTWTELEGGRRCLIGIHISGRGRDAAGTPLGPPVNHAEQLDPRTLRLLLAWRNR